MVNKDAWPPPPEILSQGLRRGPRTCILNGLPGDGDTESLRSPGLGRDLFGQTTRFPANVRAGVLSSPTAQTAQTDSKPVRRDGESRGMDRQVPGEF